MLLMFGGQNRKLYFVFRLTPSVLSGHAHFFELLNTDASLAPIIFDLLEDPIVLSVAIDR